MIHATIISMRITHAHDWTEDKTVYLRPGVSVEYYTCQCGARLARRYTGLKYGQFRTGSGLSIKTHNGQTTVEHIVLQSNGKRYAVRAKSTWSDTEMRITERQFLDANSKITAIRLY